MNKKPINFTAKDLKDAQRKLNDLVDEGMANFKDIGVNPEAVTTVSYSSDGTKREEKETVYRFIGLGEVVDEEQINELKEWTSRRETLKKERDELNRKLTYLNGKPFGPLSILLLCVGLFCGILGILTVAKVLPIPEEQNVIPIILIIVAVLAIAGCVLATVLRTKKIKGMQANRVEIEDADKALKDKENNFENDEPLWHKNAIFRIENDTLVNNDTTFKLEK